MFSNLVRYRNETTLDTEDDVLMSIFEFEYNKLKEEMKLEHTNERFNNNDHSKRNDLSVSLSGNSVFTFNSDNQVRIEYHCSHQRIIQLDKKNTHEYSRIFTVRGFNDGAKLVVFLNSNTNHIDQYAFDVESLSISQKVEKSIFKPNSQNQDFQGLLQHPNTLSSALVIDPLLMKIHKRNLLNKTIYS